MTGFGAIVAAQACKFAPQGRHSAADLPIGEKGSRDRFTHRCAIAGWICVSWRDYEAVEEYSNNWKVEPGSPNT